MSIEQPRCRVPTSGMSVSPIVEHSVSAGHQSPTIEKTLPTSSHVSPVVEQVKVCGSRSPEVELPCVSPSSVPSEVLSDDGVVVLDEGRVAEDVEVVPLADEVCASGDEEDCAVDQQMNVLDDMECVSIPPIGKSGNRDKLVLQTKEDKSLVTWRKLGDASEKGFKWKNELLYLTVPDNVFQAVDVYCVTP